MKVEISDKLLELFKARAEEEQMILADYVQRVLSEVEHTLELLHLIHQQQYRVEFGYDKEEGWWVQLCRPLDKQCVHSTDEHAGNAIAKVVAMVKRDEWKPVELDVTALENAMFRHISTQLGKRVREQRCLVEMWYTEDGQWATKLRRDDDRTTKTYIAKLRPAEGILKALAEIETWQNEWR